MIFFLLLPVVAAKMFWIQGMLLECLRDDRERNAQAADLVARIVGDIVVC